MSIIILDKETGKPIDPQRNLIDGDWVEETIGESTRRYEWHPEREPNPDPIEILITGISGAIIVSGDFSKATVYEETNIIVSGTLAIPNQNFALPIRRNDGRLFIFLAEVIDGKFNVSINFPTSGAFIYSNNECNIDLPYEVFTIKTIRFDVLRKIPV